MGDVLSCCGSEGCGADVFDLVVSGRSCGSGAESEQAPEPFQVPAPKTALAFSYVDMFKQHQRWVHLTVRVPAWVPAGRRIEVSWGGTVARVDLPKGLAPGAAARVPGLFRVEVPWSWRPGQLGPEVLLHGQPFRTVLPADARPGREAWAPAQLKAPFLDPAAQVRLWESLHNVLDAEAAPLRSPACRQRYQRYRSLLRKSAGPLLKTWAEDAQAELVELAAWSQEQEEQEELEERGQEEADHYAALAAHSAEGSPPVMVETSPTVPEPLSEECSLKQHRFPPGAVRPSVSSAAQRLMGPGV